jgi:hypothetical protein
MESLHFAFYYVELDVCSISHTTPQLHQSIPSPAKQSNNHSIKTLSSKHQSKYIYQIIDNQPKLNKLNNKQSINQSITQTYTPSNLT